MKAVVDRIVQYANRYKLTNAETGEELGTFDFEEETGTVQQVGTEIDAELFDSIANDLAKRVRVDAKQNFSAGQKQQARQNIGAAATEGDYPNMGAGYLATQIKITAHSSASVGWNKFAEISYGTASTNYSYSAILLVNGVHSTQLSGYGNTSESGKIEIDFYKEVASNPTQIGISVLSGNINVNEICAVLDSANSKIYLYSYLNLYQSISYSLMSEEQGVLSKPAKLVFTSEYYGTTAPSGAVYAVVRNRASTDADGNVISETYASISEHNIKTYAAVSQLGLSYPCTTVQIMNALPRGSRIDVAVEAINSSSTTGPNITDAPFPFGTLSIIRAADGVNNAYNRYVVTFVRGLSNDHSVFFGEYVADADTQTITSVEWKEIINADGTSTPLTAAQALYAQSIPTASETVIGGAKIYIDSDGYFCIDTQ